MPLLCSRVAAEISRISAVTRPTSPVMPLMVCAADSTICSPSCTRFCDASINPLISFADWALRCARLRTSPATTAKPRPCSPARAASTAAFNARILVWKAMPSITLMMSAMRRELSVIACILLITWLTTSLPGWRYRTRSAPVGWPARSSRRSFSPSRSAVPCWRQSLPAKRPILRCAAPVQVAGRQFA